MIIFHSVVLLSVCKIPNCPYAGACALPLLEMLERAPAAPHLKAECVKGNAPGCTQAAHSFIIH